MSKVRVDPSGDAKLGSIDGECVTCGAPRRRMGWQGRDADYWLMCTASSLGGDASPFGSCDLPTEKAARQRLAVVR